MRAVIMESRLDIWEHTNLFNYKIIFTKSLVEKKIDRKFSNIIREETIVCGFISIYIIILSIIHAKDSGVTTMG